MNQIINFLTVEIITSGLALFIAGAAVYIWRKELMSRGNAIEQHNQLLTQQLEYEKEARDSHEEWRIKAQQDYAEIAQPISKQIAKQLSENVEWAEKALHSARLIPFRNTVFGERTSHFQKEKEFIAAKFVPLLMDRIWHFHSVENKQVILIVDSGTTLFSLFKEIGIICVKQFGGRGRHPGLTMVTNNLPGCESLMMWGRSDPATNRYSELCVKCVLLPGEPLPVYCAVAGEDTIEALDSICANDDVVKIGLITGNWVRLCTGVHAHHPIPLARNKRHVEVKNAILRNCQDGEVFLVSPLGKVFSKHELSEVNSLLRNQPGSSDPEKEEYVDLNVRNSLSIKLVSTTRANEFFLNKVSENLSARLGARGDTDYKDFVQAKIGETSHLMFRFNELPKERPFQEEVEFPHNSTRRADFMRSFTLGEYPR